MKTVAILGSKGGTGKTTLAHALTYGAHLSGQPSMLIHTDHREPLSVPRPYGYVDCSKNYVQIMKLIKEQEQKQGLLVIDGAGNRPHLDLWLIQSMDLVLVPVTNNAEDVRCALRDLERFDDSRVRVLANRWPSNRLVRFVVQRYIKELPQARMAGRIADVGGMRVFLEDREWRTPVTKVNNQARRLFRMVNAMLEQMRVTPSAVAPADAMGAAAGT